MFDQLLGVSFGAKRVRVVCSNQDFLNSYCFPWDPEYTYCQARAQIVKIVWDSLLINKFVSQVDRTISVSDWIVNTP